jgi:hypothetical protein
VGSAPAGSDTGRRSAERLRGRRFRHAPGGPRDGGSRRGAARRRHVPRVRCEG